MYTMETYIKIFQYAKDNNATDIHLTPGSVPVMRVDGEIHKMPFEKVLPRDTEYLVDEVLNEEQQNHLRQRHFLNSPVVIREIGRIRANIFQQRGTYAINLKLLDMPLLDEEVLGIPKAVMDLHILKSGLILICGRRKSGKSTTLSALLRKISEKRICHIITIEDPIEHLYKHDKSIINQKEVGIDVNSFEEGIYSSMAQDPDVIMISSANEPETIAAALTAAENGHLVITTFQSGSTVETIENIIGMFPVDRRNHIKMQLSNVIEAIVTQQLIPAADEKRKVLATEIMLATDAMRNLILENKIYQIPSAIKASRSLGMQTMEDSVRELVEKGLITRETAALLL